MTNQIIPTLKYCTGSIQLKLSVSGVDGPEYVKAICPYCESKKMLINMNIRKEPRYYGSPGHRRFICGDASVKAVIKSL